MRIQPFSLGIVGTNCYVVYGYDGCKALLVDAPDGIGKAASFIQDNNLKLEAVLLTHGHFDHVLGLAEISRIFPGTEVFVSLKDKDYILSGGLLNRQLLSLHFPDILRDFGKDLDELPGSLSYYGQSCHGFEVIDTPGHTPGSVCLYNRKESLLFSGDTLFMCGYGRTDFPNGNQILLMQSLEKLFDGLEGSTDVLPGHGPATTIGAEKACLGL